jgi:hypothetical protein
MYDRCFRIGLRALALPLLLAASVGAHAAEQPAQDGKVAQQRGGLDPAAMSETAAMGTADSISLSPGYAPAPSAQEAAAEAQAQGFRMKLPTMAETAE